MPNQKRRRCLALLVGMVLALIGCAGIYVGYNATTPMEFCIGALAIFPLLFGAVVAVASFS